MVRVSKIMIPVTSEEGIFAEHNTSSEVIVVITYSECFRLSRVRDLLKFIGKIISKSDTEVILTIQYNT